MVVPDARATIIDHRGDDYKLLNFGDIAIRNQLKVFGVTPSPCSTSFEAFVVLIVGP